MKLFIYEVEFDIKHAKLSDRYRCRDTNNGLYVYLLCMDIYICVYVYCCFSVYTHILTCQ